MAPVRPHATSIPPAGTARQRPRSPTTKPAKTGCWCPRPVARPVYTPWPPRPSCATPTAPPRRWSPHRPGPPARTWPDDPGPRPAVSRRAQPTRGCHPVGVPRPTARGRRRRATGPWPAALGPIGIAPRPLPRPGVSYRSGARWAGCRERSCASGAASAERLQIASFRQTDDRWYPTVRGDRDSSAAIFRSEAPLATASATRRSCGVRVDKGSGTDAGTSRAGMWRRWRAARRAPGAPMP